jgi:hypothetical protein
MHLEALQLIGRTSLVRCDSQRPNFFTQTSVLDALYRVPLPQCPKISAPTFAKRQCQLQSARSSRNVQAVISIWTLHGESADNYVHVAIPITQGAAQCQYFGALVSG